MPIYEHYCADCHTVYSFLSRRPSSRRPSCPRCGRARLERRVSAFAISRGRAEGGDEPGDAQEAAMERVMAEMAGQVERLDESDPRQMAGLMRTLFERTGMPVGAHMEEAMRRMEAGEDPDRIEEEMGDVLEGEMGEEALSGEGLSGLRRRLRAPRVDTTLYEM